MTPGRIFKFKAWNIEEGLLVRLNKIDCQKGQLIKEGHVLLAYTGFTVRGEVEVYEKDILLIDSDKFLVDWDEQRNGWVIRRMKDNSVTFPSDFNFDNAVRLCSYFESGQVN